MNRLTAELKRFVREEEGLEMVEYAVVGGLLIAAGAAVWTALGENVTQIINEIIATMGGTPA